MILRNSYPLCSANKFLKIVGRFLQMDSADDTVLGKSYKKKYFSQREKECS